MRGRRVKRSGRIASQKKAGCLREGTDEQATSNSLQGRYRGARMGCG
jgi:hypothetical protein